MNVLLACLVLSGIQSESTVATKNVNLDPSTKPLFELPFLKGKKLVTVSESPKVAGDPMYSHWTRIFRYTWKGDFEKLKANWTFHFKEAEGWKFEPELDTAIQFGIYRTVKHPKVQWQALIFSQNKLVFDPSALAMTRSIHDHKWIRVSYNEQYRIRPTPAKVLKKP